MPFHVNPENAHMTFPDVEFACNWILGPLFADACDVAGVQDPQRRARASAKWLKKSSHQRAGLITGHTIALARGRNLEDVMTAQCGGYNNWQFGEGGTEEAPTEHSRGLWMGFEAEFDEPMPADFVGTMVRRFDGMFQGGGAAYVRFVAELYGLNGAHYQTIRIMSRVAGAAVDSLPKAARSTLKMPTRNPDHSEVHNLAGKNTCFKSAMGTEDPNLRHVDDEDPRLHGPLAAGILSFDMTAGCLDYDHSRVVRMVVPGVKNPFYANDTVQSRVWKESERLVVGQLVRWPETEKEQVVLDQVEWHLAV